ncbi:MAG: ATP-binding cassette domain-containing protein, partial [Verrucomicrobiota bacterium]
MKTDAQPSRQKAEALPAAHSGTAGELLVSVENVSKIFCRDLKKSLLYGLKDSVRDLLSWGGKNDSTHQSSERKLRPGEFYAVNGVSLNVRRGECLSLVGHNGAGKTTLLKMLNGLIKPDTGRIEMKGKVGGLIALGAGFNPLLTGRENIYVNGSVLGLSQKGIKSKINDIIDFADIDDFIDAPVRTYSSGMQVRLGFAIAT